MVFARQSLLKRGPPGSAAIRGPTRPLLRTIDKQKLLPPQCTMRSANTRVSPMAVL